MDIPITRGQPPPISSREHAEFLYYDSGDAEAEIRRRYGDRPDRWLTIVRDAEPHSIPAFEFLKHHPHWSRYLRGDVLDCGAGTCWLSAAVSQLPNVNRVTAHDLSEGFLTTVGLETFLVCSGMPQKLCFSTGTFYQLPFAPESFHAVFLFAVLHHSVAPISLIREAIRVLSPEGVVFVMESPHPPWKLRRMRRHAVELSKNTTEIPMTCDDITFVFQMAGVNNTQQIPLDCVSRSAWRKRLRKILRWTKVENLLRPPTSIFILQKGSLL